MEDDLLEELESELEDIQRNEAEVINEEKSSEIFVSKNAPEYSYTYKDRLKRVYYELSNLNDDDIKNQILKITDELAQIIASIEEVDKAIKDNTSVIIDEKRKTDADLHYIKGTKSVVVKEAKDNYLSRTFTGVFWGLIVLVIALVIALCLK